MLKVDAVKGTTVICSNKQRQKQFRVWKPEAFVLAVLSGQNTILQCSTLIPHPWTTVI